MIDLTFYLYLELASLPVEFLDCLIKSRSLCDDINKLAKHGIVGVDLKLVNFDDLKRMIA